MNENIDGEIIEDLENAEYSFDFDIEYEDKRYQIDCDLICNIDYDYADDEIRIRFDVVFPFLREDHDFANNQYNYLYDNIAEEILKQLEKRFTFEIETDNSSWFEYRDDTQEVIMEWYTIVRMD